MAQYGYSTPYTGQQVQTLPPGFMEAATASGRNLAAGIAAMGQNLGRALEQYRSRKAETEAATQSFETVSGLMQQQLAADPKYIALQQYMETGALPQGVSEQDIPRYTQQVMADREMLNKFSTLGEKFPDMSLAKKKAALGDAVMVLNQYRTDQQKQADSQLRDLQLRQLRSQLDTQKQMSDLMRYGIQMPQEMTVTDQVTETIQPEGPVPPGPMGAAQDTSAPSMGERIAARYFMGRAGEAAQALGRYGTDLGRQAAALNTSTQPQPSYPVSFPFPGRPAPFSSETPVQAAARAEANMQARGNLMQQAAAATQQADIMRRMPPVGSGVRPPQAQPAQEQFLPPEEVTRTVTRTEQVPYEQLRRNMAQFAAQQGMNPEVFASLDKVLEIAGKNRPAQVESISGLGSIVRFGDKEQFVPAAKTDINDLLKVRGVTIDFPEFKGTAPTEKEATDFRDQYSNVLSSRRNLQRLLEIAQMGKLMQQTPQIKAEAEQLARAAQGALRLDIIGPGTVTDTDRKLLESIVRNPTDIFSLKSSNVKSLNSLLERAGSGIESKAKSIGLEVLKPTQQQPAAAAGRAGVLRYNPLTKKLE
jgi:hypothetical protein